MLCADDLYTGGLRVRDHDAPDLYAGGAAMSFSRALHRKDQTPVVRFEDVAIRYGSGPDVLSGISFHLRPGSFHFVAGPSGSGKSSLLRTMFLANNPAEGRMTLFGRDSTSLTRDERALFRRQRLASSIGSALE